MVTQAQVDEVNKVLRGEKTAEQAKEDVLKLDKPKNKSSGRGNRQLPSDNPELVAAVEEAKAQGYSNADIVNAATQGKELLPSQSSKVQEFARLAQEEGFSNADIVNAAAQGKDLLPSQSSRTREYVDEAKARGATNADIINATTGAKPTDENINPATGRPYGTYEEDTRSATKKFLDKLSSTQTEVALRVSSSYVP